MLVIQTVLVGHMNTSISKSHLIHDMVLIDLNILYQRLLLWRYNSIVMKVIYNNLLEVEIFFDSGM